MPDPYDLPQPQPQPPDHEWRPPYGGPIGDSEGGGGRNPANQRDTYRSREGYTEGGLQTGIEGDVNYRVNIGVDPSLMSPGSAMVRNNNPLATRDYTAQAGQADAFTRQAQENEMSAYHLEQMLASDSPLMQRARMQAMAGAGGRGLMNSSIAQGAAMGSMIDRAQPFALQDATMHGRAATESLAARNQAELTNAQLLTNANVAGMNANANRDGSLLNADLTGQNDLLRHTLGIETREDQQQWQEMQNDLQRAWQSGENRQAAMEDWAKNAFTVAQQRGATREQALAQVLQGIYQNPDMTAEEQAAAAENARAIIGSTYGNGDQAPAKPPPGYGTVPAAGGERTASPTDGSAVNPFDALMGEGYSADAAAASVGMGTVPVTNPAVAAANQAAGQSYDSASNPTAKAVTEALDPIV